jgi:hypothetical protein
VNGDAADVEESEHRVFVNLLATIALLVLAIAAIWLLEFLDDKRQIQSCLEAGRNDCSRQLDSEAR